MMLGRSPMSVAVPPMLEAMISARKNGTASMSSRRHTVMVMGPMSRTVVTLSSRAESSAVRADEEHHDVPGAALREARALDGEVLEDAPRAHHGDEEHHAW